MSSERVRGVQVGPKEPLRVRGRSVGRRGESLKLHVEVTAVGHTRVLSFRCDFHVHDHREALSSSLYCPCNVASER
jgi:hypothetical protein